MSPVRRVVLAAASAALAVGVATIPTGAAVVSADSSWGWRVKPAKPGKPKPAPVLLAPDAPSLSVTNEI